MEQQTRNELKIVRASALGDDLDDEFDCDECGRSVFCGPRWVQLVDPDEDLCLDCAIGRGWTVTP